MSESQGKFVWYELMSPDPAAAERFYGSVIGWTAQDAGMPDMKYTLLSAGPVQVGGLMAVPPGAPPGWVGYVFVDDVDAKTAEAKRLGGAVYREPSDIPGVGRFAVIGDPQGAGLALYHSNSSGQPEQPMGTPGHTAWHELHSTDHVAGFSFYAQLFGWEKGEAMDMGPMGTYQLFTRNGVQLGGMMNGPSGPPSWLFYVAVDNIDAALGRIEAGGGKPVMGPQQVPGGGWIVQAIDPQGVPFAVVGPRP